MGVSESNNFRRYRESVPQYLHSGDLRLVPGADLAAIGLGTDLRRLRKLGLRPLGVGLAAALGVGVLSAGLIRLFLT